MPACPQAADAADVIARGQEQRRRKFIIPDPLQTAQSLSIQRLALAKGTIARDTNKRTRRCCKRILFARLVTVTTSEESLPEISRTLIFSFG
jgi:hypothetical protein